MSRELSHGLPVQIEDPASVRTGELFLADISSVGLWVADIQTIVRAVCTLGERHREFELAHCLIADRHTAVIEYEDQEQYQIEFLLDGQSVAGPSVRQLEEYVEDEGRKLVIVVDGKIGTDARQYCNSRASVDLIKLDPQYRDDIGLWNQL